MKNDTVQLIGFALGISAIIIIEIINLQKGENDGKENGKQ